MAMDKETKKAITKAATSVVKSTALSMATGNPAPLALAVAKGSISVGKTVIVAQVKSRAAAKLGQATKEVEVMKITGIEKTADGSRDIEVEVVKATVVSFSRKAKEKYEARKSKGKKKDGQEVSEPVTPTEEYEEPESPLIFDPHVPGWSMHQDADGITYHFHQESQVSLFEAPRHMVEHSEPGWSEVDSSDHGLLYFHKSRSDYGSIPPKDQ